MKGRAKTFGRAACAAMVVAAVLAAAACGGHPHRGAATAIDWAPLAREAREVAAQLDVPEECKQRLLIVGEVTVARQPPGRTEDPVADAGPLPIDPEELRAALGDLLRASGAFREVIVPRKGPAPAPDGPALLLETELSRADVRRTGADGGLAGRVASWVFLGWMATWRHDRSYALELEPRFRLMEGRTRQLLLDVPCGVTRTSDALSLHERRGGVLPFVATIFCVPYFAFDSKPREITRALAHASLAGPVQSLLSNAADLQTRYRVAVGPAGAVGLELLHPKPGDRLLEPASDIQIRVKAPDGRKIVKVALVLEGRPIEKRTAGEVVRPRFDKVPLDPGQPIEVQVVLDQGPPVRAQLVVHEELSRAPERRRRSGP